MMTNSAKTAVWEVHFRPFGEVATVSGTATLNQRFPGQWYQLEAGLAYNWHRHYDATIGRYLQPDPLGFVDGPSVYAYVRSSPVMRKDFDGLWSVSASYFRGFGGSLTVGYDPSLGAGFSKVRLGVGIGGGISWDPNDTAPTQQSCVPSGLNVGMGLYGSGSAGMIAGGSLDIGVNNNLFLGPKSEGGGVEIQPYYPTWPVSGNISSGNVRKLGAEASVGIQFNGFYK